MKTIQKLLLLVAPLVFVSTTFLFFNAPVQALIKGWTPPSQETPLQDENIDSSESKVMLPSEEDNDLGNQDVVAEDQNYENSVFEDDQVFPFISGFDSYR
ncbi:hypothetical protein [Prochlorococcus sp. MIT 1300]|uniref:hypothetical protein n=1 Tax=Prochlorococcus sp. MIT 1300 TaxID=3096218 RepID=UPI002A74D464|nr:hypothetical protein [Prochlorococcus sp. MIT 1300]